MRMLLSCGLGERTVPLINSVQFSQFKTRPDAQRKRTGRKALPKRDRRRPASGDRGQEHVNAGRWADPPSVSDTIRTLAQETRVLCGFLDDGWGRSKALRPYRACGRRRTA